MQTFSDNAYTSFSADASANVFTAQDLEKMVGWDANLESPVKEGYIITDNIITSISYNFVKWGLAFGRMIGIDIPPETFGI